MRGRVVVRGDHAERHVAHVVELVVVGDVAGADQRMPALSSPRSANCFMKAAPWPGGQEHEHRVGLGVAHLLQERREIGAAQRRAQLVEHLAAVRR